MTRAQMTLWAQRIFAATLAAAATPVCWAGPQQVEQAVLLIRAACGAVEGASLEMQNPGDGRLYVRLTAGTAVRGATQLVRSDLDRFADVTMAITGRLPLDVTACMEPSVNQVIQTLMALPMLPTAPAATAGGSPGQEAPGGYLPPVQAPAVATPLPPAAPPQAAVAETSAAVSVPAASGMAATATPAGGTAATPSGDVTMAIQGCHASGRSVVCDVSIRNGGRDDWSFVLQGRQTLLYDASGGAWEVDEIRLGNQGKLDYRGQARFRVIADTAPVLSLRFDRIPELVRSVKRLEVMLGPETVNGLRLQKLTLSDATIQGR